MASLNNYDKFFQCSANISSLENGPKRLSRLVSYQLEILVQFAFVYPHQQYKIMR
ncbi:34875_t:CDS:2 [Gigaspora margarita]|uniref:34875_t:CDS:1 n=1 Tax=Gigaspora margarita TaxID=4874 RepID=A0ABN7UT54_GIGMA|nr:34875_t:CDS:2 [Gigaspora margarita]